MPLIAMLLLCWLPGSDRAAKKSLLEAIRHNDTAKLAKLLDEGADPNQKISGETLLTCAAREGYDDIVRLLLDKGAESTDRQGNNPITAAMNAGRITCVKTLLEYGAAVNVTDDFGRTPLMLAVKRANNGLIRLFVAAGVDVNQRDFGKNAALHYAVKTGNLEAISILLKAGADPDIRDRFDNTALGFANFLKNESAIALLLGRPASSSPNADLVQAAATADIAGVMQALKGGADINGKSGANQMSPLYGAAETGDRVLVSLLLDKGAEIDQQTNFGMTALSTATAYGRLEVVRLLVARGANLDLVAGNGLTALGFAAAHRDQALTRVLADAGARLLMVNANGERMLLDYRNRNAISLVKQMKKIPRKEIFSGRLQVPAGDFATVGALGVTPPIFTKKVQPQYPASAIPQKIEGYVIVGADLNPDGTFSNIVVMRDLEDWRYGFEYQSIKALKEWEFEPGLVNGVPTTVRMCLKIDFVLKNGLNTPAFLTH